jgi:hypothetical protein
LVILAAGGITIGATGSIDADGQSATGANQFNYGLKYSGGGGGGGIVVLASRTSIVNSGTLVARGGMGADGSWNSGSSGPLIQTGPGGGGGGGIINLFAAYIVAGAALVTGGSGGHVGSGQPLGGYAGGGGGSYGSGGSTSDLSNGDGYSGGDGIVSTTITPDPATLFVPNVHFN